ncbi:MAG: molybdopterin-dependent oxidoreductase [Candidatus Tectomicrobia bacterium]|nr:molybdopterin-dependent oxidoreductase [Candidatus Tectomicrobia bacterium]
MPRGKPSSEDQFLVEPVAGNGLLDRRVFLTQGLALLGAGGLAAVSAPPAHAADPPHVPPWMQSPGAGMSEYGSPAKYESKVIRTLIQSRPGTTGSGASRTPIEALDGMITPSGLHFERHHSGVPDIDPDKHRLLIHGLVKRPLIFTVEALLRYPMVSRLHFLECSGNSQLMYGPTPPVLTCGQVHGLVSCSEWTGVPLRLLLEEAGADPQAPWLLAEGADAAAMSRSVPMAKALDDALLALYQNGERLRPENGYPVRLFLPGYEGNMNVKWLRRLKVTPTPLMTDECANIAAGEDAEPRQFGSPGIAVKGYRYHGRREHPCEMLVAQVHGERHYGRHHSGSAGLARCSRPLDAPDRARAWAHPCGEHPGRDPVPPLRSGDAGSAWGRCGRAPAPSAAVRRACLA